MKLMLIISCNDLTTSRVLLLRWPGHRKWSHNHLNIIIAAIDKCTRYLDNLAPGVGLLPLHLIAMVMV